MYCEPEQYIAELNYSNMWLQLTIVRLQCGRTTTSKKTADQLGVRSTWTTQSGWLQTVSRQEWCHSTYAVGFNSSIQHLRLRPAEYNGHVAWKGVALDWFHAVLTGHLQVLSLILPTFQLILSYFMSMSIWGLLCSLAWQKIYFLPFPWK